MSADNNLQLARVSARGVVQGVGFRPFVYGLAVKHNLNGWVCNTSEDVKIEVEGNREALNLFIYELEHNAPPMARIEEISATFDSPCGYHGFEIRSSVAQTGKYQLVSPDIATCQQCLEDIFDPNNRRWHYPFTNCTNCGPRFTIIRDIPYDRPLTTMAAFKMCPDCQREYENPLDRRFHAQPNACPACGPQLELTDNRGNQVSCSDIIKATAELLDRGKIIAIKGLGGFLLACNAKNAQSVKTLRQRKRRPSKPFAIMVKDISEAAGHCFINYPEEDLLRSPQSPIVLLRWKPESDICREVAPALKHLGVMLPYTPLHHLLMREVSYPLVMTSGNISEEPIAGENGEAISRLGEIADFFLLHNRDIYSTYDDSVTSVINGRPYIIRRARGYAPYPVHLTFQTPQILACGAEEKNTFCLARDNHAFVSQHIGDLENLETMEHYERTIDLYRRLFRIEPEIIAHDLHPEYLSTKYALELAEASGLKTAAVQHHHAHIASCLADNLETGSAIGVAFDGTGYGTDCNIWGGEFLIADYTGFKRMGQLEYLPLPGGSLAIKKPYRTAFGYLAALNLLTFPFNKLPFINSIDRNEQQIIIQQIESRINTPVTSSMGRLFDAVSAICGICGVINYEAQAAIELESKAYEAPQENGIYPVDIENRNGYLILRLSGLIKAIAEDLQNNVSIPRIAMRFHNSLANVTRDVCLELRQKSGLGTVALSGGCFQNRLLLIKILESLQKAGFNVIIHRQVPANDGGISLGQAVIAASSSGT